MHLGIDSRQWLSDQVAGKFFPLWKLRSFLCQNIRRIGGKFLLNIFFGRARMTELQTNKTRNKECGKNFILRVRCTMVGGVSRNIGGVKHCELLGLRLDLGYSECNEFLIKQSIQEFNKRLLFVGI